MDHNFRPDYQAKIHAIQNHGSTYAIDDRTWTAEVLVDWKSGFKLDGYPLEADAIVQDDFDMEAYDDEEYLDEDVWDKGPYQAVSQHTKARNCILKS